MTTRTGQPDADRRAGAPAHTARRRRAAPLARGTRCRPALLSALLFAAVLVLLPGCASSLKAPQRLISPYDTTGGDALWAVVPMRNMTGTTDIDPLDAADALVRAVEEVEGITCLPVNRTIIAMRALGIESVETPANAEELARTLDVDGLVLGVVTAWDPYSPPKVGVHLLLYHRPGTGGSRTPRAPSPERLQRAASDADMQEFQQFVREPVATSALLLDGRDHGVVAALQRYTVGRVDPNSPMGWQEYLASMRLFVQFAMHESTARLLDSEWGRLARAAAPTDG